ncbi:cytochrome c oxidase subunit II [Tessaracoccus sp. HF-7]|uniref:aa3-type cytochrome oxidase subunit II n=1 Tax=Tessaracoccus caeni TaxID=3031239 RepID=UPI0023DBB87C|nr:cytochrome c oxidase subunit II [Tessaracoccus caeni]MDF1486860.1 cytochrome c oxidase subunit II [Tessaracoccus caeni]
MGNLWVGAWIASLVIGLLVWGLIGWSVFRYRSKDGDNTAPRQTKYHLPLELLYTLVPFLIIGVMFFYTMKAADGMLDQSEEPDLQVNVIGQKWSWTFNYMEQDNPAVGAVVHERGTMEQLPDLYLPINKRVRFNLESVDVIHSFWIPEFYTKLDVIPGVTNSFDVTPNKLGDYTGKCAELCGTYHSAMLFHLHVVTEEEYEAKLKEMVAEGATGEYVPPKDYSQVIPAAINEEHE